MSTRKAGDSDDVACPSLLARLTNRRAGTENHPITDLFQCVHDFRMVCPLERHEGQNLVYRGSGFMGDRIF